MFGLPEYFQGNQIEDQITFRVLIMPRVYHFLKVFSNLKIWGKFIRKSRLTVKC